MSLPLQSSTPAPTSQRLIVIDSALAQDASLLAHLPEGATVLVLDPSRGALEQLIEAAAAQPHAIQTVDILSHGGEGFVSLGGLQLDATSLSAHADELALLGQWLAPGADLLLYGCSVAEGGRGQAFIEALAAATGTDVAASTNPTGATQLGGDSVLERWAGTGSMDAVPLDLSEWPGLLAVTPGLKDVLYTHTTSSFISGFTLTTSVPLGDTVPADPGIYLDVGTGNPNGWFEVSANGTELGGFDLTALTLAKYQNSAALTVTVVGTKLGSGETVSATITTAAGSSTFAYPSFSAFTGLLKFRLEISGTPNAAYITFDSFSIANVVDPGAAGNQAPSLIATAVDPVFHEGDSLPADLFRGVTASATEGTQNIDRITLTVSGVTNGIAELLRVDGQNLALVQGITTTTPGLGLSASVSVSGNTATVTLTKAGGITSAQASAVIDGLGYRNTFNISADSTRVVTLTSLRDTGGTAGGGVDAKTFSIASTVQLKAATGNVTDELVDVLWHHTTSNFATGFSLATSTPLGTQGTSADPGIYLGGNGDGWFEVAANGTDVGGFDLTGLTLDKFAPAGAFTITVVGTKLGSGDTVSATITSAAGSDSFVYPSFSAFTGLLKFRIDISGTQSAGFITFDSFRVDNIVAPGAIGNQAPALTATAVDPVFHEGATLAADLFSNVSASATESTQNIDRITLTVSGLANGAAEFLRVDSKSISLVNGATTTTVDLGLSASVSVSGNTATITLTKTGGITSAQASALIDGLGYRNTADISADSTRVVTLTSLRDTGGTAGGGIDAKTFNIASTVNLKAATGNATDELVDVLWNHTPSSFATGFSLATSMPLGTQGTNADPGIYLGGSGDGWFEVSADGTSVSGFDLTALALDKYAPAGQFTITVIGTKLGTGDTVSATITSAAGSDSFVYPSFSAFTGLLKFRIEITGNQNAAYITFDSFRVAHVQEPNVAPVIANLNNDSVSFTEGVAPVLLDTGSNATLTDADSSDFAGGNVTAVFTAGAAAGDVLAIRNEGTGAGQIGVSGSSVSYAGTGIGTVAGGTGGSALVINLNASATPAAVQALLRNLSYTNAGDDPSGAARTVSITVNDGDGGTSTAAAVTVNVTPVNDAPTLIATGGTPTFTEDDSAVALFSGTAISTVEAGQTVTALTLTVAGLADGANEKLSIDGVTFALTAGTSGTTATHNVGYSVAVNGTTATVTLTGTFTPAQAQTLVNGLTYRNDSQSPTTTDRTVTLTSLTDSGGAAHGGVDTTILSLAATVHLQAVNDAPTLTGAPTSVPETTEDEASSGTLVSALLSSLGYADPDGSGLPSGVAITATTGRGHWQYATNGVSWTDVGTVGPASALLLNATTFIRYQPDAQNGETATLTVRAWDQTVGTASTVGAPHTFDTTTNGGSSAFSSATGQATLLVTSVNDAPTDITLDPGSVPENSNGPDGKVVGLLTTTDVDFGDSFAYSIAGGVDAAAFEISNGALKFKSGVTLDFETQSSYSVTVRSTDAGGAHVEKDLTVHLNDENEAPFVAQALTAQQAVATRTFAFTVPADAFRDPDAGDTLSYTASTADGSTWPSWLQFDPVTREFAGTPAAGDASSVSIRVTATDSALHTASADFTLTVLNGPSIHSIVRQDGAASLTNATEVVYTVTFTERVTGVDVTDFELDVTDTAAGNVTEVQTADGVTYTVKVSELAGDGTLRLDLKSDDTQIESYAHQITLIAGHSGGETYTLDHTPPATPTLALASDTGASSTDGITADPTVDVSGLESGGSWQYSIDGGNNWTPGSGSSFELAEGSHAAGAVRVRQTDAAGNTSPTGQAPALTIDSQAPTALNLSHNHVRTVAGADAVVGTLSTADGGTAGAPFSYTLVAGAGDDDNALFTLLNGQLRITDPLAAGPSERSVRIATTDAAGNTFEHVLLITVAANALPVIAGVPVAAEQIESGVASLLADFTVSDADDGLALTVQLTATNGTLGQLTTGTFGTVTVTATSDGYLFQGDSSGINTLLASATFTATAPGAASVLISVTDGHDDPVSTVYAMTAVDTVPPDAPTGLALAAGSDTGASATDGITRDATPTLEGRAEAFSTVAVYSGSTLIGSTTADAQGAWSFTPTTALDDGVHWLTAHATDASDNESVASAELRVTIDTTAPTLPTLSNANIRTHVGRDAVVGTLSASDAGSSLTFALVGGTGSTDNALFSIDGQKLVLLDPAAAGAGARSVRVSVTDAAGNLSEQSFQITVSANTVPTLTGVPTAAQPITVGQAAALADLKVADADGDALTVTLTPVNGSIGGLPASGSSGATWTEADGVLTLSGTASAINALLADATFTATTAAAASIAIRVSDGIVNAPVTATYALTPGLVLTGSASSELLKGSSGNDRIDGGDGLDWLSYAGPLSAHALQVNAAGEWQVRSSAEGTDTLLQVERLLFSDGALALDLQDAGHAVQAARLITTLLGPQTLDNRALAGEVLAYVDAVGPVQLLQTLQELGVLSALAGGDAPEQLATLIYTNLVGQAPNDAQLQEVLDYQSAHGLDAVGLVWAASQLPLAAQRAGLVETSTTGWAFEVFGGVLFGSAQDDTLTASVVAQHIDGREGIDTLLYAGTQAQHEVHLREGGGWTVERSGPFTDQLVNVERLQFSDGALALDLDGHAGEAARLLATLAGAQALDDAALVGVVLQAVDERGLDGAARLALESGFAAQWAGGDTLQQLIANAYVHITGHAAADWEVQAFADHAQASGWDNAQTLAVIARLPDTAQSIDLIGLSQQGLAYEPWIAG